MLGYSAGSKLRSMLRNALALYVALALRNPTYILTTFPFALFRQKRSPYPTYITLVLGFAEETTFFLTTFPFALFRQKRSPYPTYITLVLAFADSTQPTFNYVSLCTFSAKAIAREMP